MDLDSISVNTINKYLQFIREFYRFVCRENGIKPKNLELTKELKKYINFNEFKARTIDKYGFMLLKNDLVFSLPEGDFNHRDKCLLTLAWEGLSNSDIKYLHIDDICFYEEYGVKKAKLFLRRRGRTLVIDDEETIDTLKKTITEKKYYKIEEIRERESFIQYKDTPMLIRPVAMRQSTKDEVANPSMILNTALKKLEGRIPGIKVEKLSLEDIKRSRIVELFKEGVSIQTVKAVFGKKTESDLGWISEVANLIRREEKQMGLSKN